MHLLSTHFCLKEKKWNLNQTNNSCVTNLWTNLLYFVTNLWLTHKNSSSVVSVWHLNKRTSLNSTQSKSNQSNPFNWDNIFPVKYCHLLGLYLNLSLMFMFVLYLLTSTLMQQPSSKGRRPTNCPEHVCQASAMTAMMHTSHYLPPC